MSVFNDDRDRGSGEVGSGRLSSGLQIAAEVVVGTAP